MPGFNRPLYCLSYMGTAEGEGVEPSTMTLAVFSRHVAAPAPHHLPWRKRRELNPHGREPSCLANTRGYHFATLPRNTRRELNPRILLGRQMPGPFGHGCVQGDRGGRPVGIEPFLPACDGACYRYTNYPSVWPRGVEPRPLPWQSNAPPPMRWPHASRVRSILRPLTTHTVTAKYDSALAEGVEPSHYPLLEGYYATVAATPARLPQEESNLHRVLQRHMAYL